VRGGKDVEIPDVTKPIIPADKAMIRKAKKYNGD